MTIKIKYVKISVRYRKSTQYRIYRETKHKNEIKNSGRIMQKGGECSKTGKEIIGKSKVPWRRRLPKNTKVKHEKFNEMFERGKSYGKFC